MIPDTAQPLTADEVTARIRAELDAPQSKPPNLEARMATVRALQSSFRKEPVGGRLMQLKRLVFWFSASAFDRQAKVVEALIDVTEELERENRRLSDELERVRNPTKHHE